MSDDGGFEIFYLKSLDLHRSKHPNIQLDEQHFRGLALAKWHLLSDAQRACFHLADENKKKASHQSK